MNTTQSTAFSSVKTEPDVKLSNETSADVKQEFNVLDASPADDDIYEDAGDLDFSNAAQGLFLTRIPKYIWENWSQLDENEEIRLGTVRVEGGFDKLQRMSLLLHPDVARKGDLPAEYILEVVSAKPANTFVFNEKDLPGYLSKERASSKTNSGVTASAAARLTHQSQGPQGIDKHRRGAGRRGIPKQTALVGRIHQEINCLPVDNPNYKQVMERRAREAERKTRRKSMLEPGLVSATGGATLASGPGVAFDSFIKTNSKKGEKSQKAKAARIPQNELLDLIYECFKQYEYWPMKALIDHLKQPAAYLKDTLEIVAHLVRSGRFANNWQLKPENKTGAYDAYAKAKDEKAPDEGLEEVSDFEGEQDEDDEEMVDVLPS